MIPCGTKAWTGGGSGGGLSPGASGSSTGLNCNRGGLLRFDVLPTEFDGTADALYQPYDRLSRLHMEYLADHGTFSDLPLQRVIDDMNRHYPGMVKSGNGVKDSDRFENDAIR